MAHEFFKSTKRIENKASRPCGESDRHTVAFEDTKNLVPSHESDLGNTMRITKSDANLRGGKTLASKLGDVVDDIIGGRL